MGQIRLVASLFLWFLCTLGAAADDVMFVYRIGTVRQMLSCPDPGGNVYYLEVKEGTKSTCTLVSRSKLIPYLKELKLKEPEQLAGTAFQDQSEDPLAAIKHQLTKAAVNAHYPELYQLAAGNLARLEFPSFPTFDKQTVYEAFSAAYWDRDWVDGFAKKIQDVSGQTVKVLIDITPPKPASGPAKYFILTDGHRSIRVTFGPYPTPFTPSD